MRPTLRLFDGYPADGNPNTSVPLRASVREMQNLLSVAGFKCSPDGFFGPATQGAVEAFQLARGLLADGIVGAMTWAALLGVPKPARGTFFETHFSPENYSLNQEMEVLATYEPVVRAVAADMELPVALICGIGSRESRWGLALVPRGPAGTGDFIKRNRARPWRDGPLPPDGGGYGRGLMQIDYDAHEFARNGGWQEPGANIRYGALVLKDAIRAVQQRYMGNGSTGERGLRGGIAAYNCGAGNVIRALDNHRDVDYYTHGRDYSRDVLARAGWFQMKGWL